MIFYDDDDDDDCLFFVKVMCHEVKIDTILEPIALNKK